MDIATVSLNKRLSLGTPTGNTMRCTSFSYQKSIFGELLDTAYDFIVPTKTIVLGHAVAQKKTKDKQEEGFHIEISPEAIKVFIDALSSTFADIRNQTFKFTKEEAIKMLDNSQMLKDAPVYYEKFLAYYESNTPEDFKLFMSIKTFFINILELKTILEYIATGEKIKEGELEYLKFWDNMVERASQTSPRTKISGSINDLMSDI